MVLKEAEEKFIAAWGAIGTQWGINRTMAQIHALLLISEKSLSAEEIMSKLNISRGNVNMNVRDLMSWGLVHKVLKFGERKEFFTAEKDIYKTAIQILRERRKRELVPILNLLGDLESNDISDDKSEHFKKVVGDIHSFGNKTNKILDKMSRADENWFTGSLMKILMTK
jgi:DNA-binding transcriptional regulator GbsR (MarR family)